MLIMRITWFSFWKNTLLQELLRKNYGSWMKQNDFLEIFLNFFGTPVVLIMKLTVLYGTSWDIEELKVTGFYVCFNPFLMVASVVQNLTTAYLTGLFYFFTAVKICEIEAIFLEPHTRLLATKVRCSSIYGITSFIYVTIALVSRGFPRKD